MPTPSIHTHRQDAQANAQSKACQRVWLPQRTDDRKESTIAQHCIRAIAGAVVKSRSVHLINFGSSGQAIALKSATDLILDRCGAY